MAYAQQNFQVGQQLTAAALNKMDAQIALNAAGVEAFSRQMIIDELETLSLETDGEYIILKLGDMVIGETAIADVSGVVPCTGLDITSALEIAVDAGGTAAITCQRQPSDCNQTVRFRSGDMGIATVTSQGQVTGVDVGVCPITVLCGGVSQTVQAKVSKIVSPTWITGNYIYNSGTDKYDSPSARLEQNSESRVCVFPQEGSENIFIKAGQKVSVTYNGTGDYNFQLAYAIAPLTDDGFAYTEDWSGRLCVANCRFVADIFGDTAGHAAPIEYTATEDCYLIFAFKSDERTGEEYTAEQVEEVRNGLITVRISVA